MRFLIKKKILKKISNDFFLKKNSENNFKTSFFKQIFLKKLKIKKIFQASFLEKKNLKTCVMRLSYEKILKIICRQNKFS